MTALPLVFDAPRRGKPPRHLADLAPQERRVAVEELGERAFRAQQVSRAYFAGRSIDEMTDLGADSRDRLAALLPDLLAPVREVDCDAGETRKTVWRLHDGALV